MGGLLAVFDNPPVNVLITGSEHYATILEKGGFSWIRDRAPPPFVMFDTCQVFIQDSARGLEGLRVCRKRMGGLVYVCDCVEGNLAMASEELQTIMLEEQLSGAIVLVVAIRDPSQSADEVIESVTQMLHRIRDRIPTFHVMSYAEIDEDVSVDLFQWLQSAIYEQDDEKESSEEEEEGDDDALTLPTSNSWFVDEEATPQGKPPVQHPHGSDSEGSYVGPDLATQKQIFANEDSRAPIQPATTPSKPPLPSAPSTIPPPLLPTSQPPVLVRPLPATLDAHLSQKHDPLLE
jgi:hypothetical protein